MNLVIPMAGRGTRFRDAGYATYKPFIPIQGKPMIAYVTEAFPAEVRKFIITSRELLSDDEADYLEGNLDCEIIDIATHKEGPAFSIYSARGSLPLDESFFIAYCDIFWTWIDQKFPGDLDADGIIFTQSGFHPHLVQNNYSAFCLPADNDPTRLREIREKSSFTDDWMNEPLSIGAFYVKSGAEMMDGIGRMIADDERVSGEFFPSLLFNHLNFAGKDIRLHPVDFFIHWGVPSQLDDFERWRRVGRFDADHAALRDPSYPENIVCMAGLGARMAGVAEQPKALIPVDGLPMYRFVADRFPSRSETLITIEPIAAFAKEQGFNGAFEILADQTASQYETLVAAADMLRPKSDFFLTSCDAYGLFEIDEFRRFTDRNASTAVIFTFRPSLTQAKLKGQHTHVSVDNDRVLEVHIKSKTSHDDLGLAGFFWLRDGSIFEMIGSVPVDPNNEMCVDHIFKHFVDEGIVVSSFELEHDVHLGTPEELCEHRYWKRHGPSVHTADIANRGR